MCRMLNFHYVGFQICLKNLILVYGYAYSSYHHGHDRIGLMTYGNSKVKDLGPVVQSIVSLTTSLRCRLVKYMPTKLSNTLLFLAHLSRRVIGELIVYKGIRRPSVVRSSVSLSTFSNDISSEAVRPILLIFHI